MLRILKILLFGTFLSTTFCESYTPIVMWHGLGDTCCNPKIMGKLSEALKKTLPGVHVVSLRIGNSTFEDFLNGFVMHPDEKIKRACNIIKSDPLLAKGYNALGISQGSQFIRALAQRCPEPRMKNLITMAGQHQGVYGLPLCDGKSKPWCNFIHRTINQVVYLSFIQKQSVQASYWHNPLNEEAYRTKNSFIAEINNEKFINQSYIKNLQLLENFVMVKHERDRTVQPAESSWFGFYKPGQSKETQTLRESDLYISDRLGLKQMDRNGKLHFLSVPWEHTEFHWSWFKENIVNKFFR